MDTISTVVSQPNVAPHIVIFGLESTGKSAVFRCLTRNLTGRESNFRGSTVSCRKALSYNRSHWIVDTPGIRLEEDTLTTALALTKMREADVLLLVARGTDLKREIEILLSVPGVLGKEAAIIVTFSDKSSFEIEQIASHYRRALAVPLVTIDARFANPELERALNSAISQACAIKTAKPATPPINWFLQPSRSIFERRWIGPLMSTILILVMWIIPVMAAYGLSTSIQVEVDPLIKSLSDFTISHCPSLIGNMLVGPYGILSLGGYSFIWAFPVVFFLGISTAICEETGIQDRLTRSLDPLMRMFGLAGRDLLPFLTGFGCNVVAVQQSRACSQCTRKQCVTAISFGSACSYQIGATLSILGAAGSPRLFLLYLPTLAVTGLIHTRLWHGASPETMKPVAIERAFLSAPRLKAVVWKAKAAVGQFLLQAMPVFLLICFLAFCLKTIGALTLLSNIFTPVLQIFGLPAESAPGVVFSFIRKDGLMLINEDGGGLIRSFTTAQLFLLIWFGSTLSPCLVTLWTIYKEMTLRVAASILLKQFTTSVVVGLIIVIFSRYIS